MSQSPLPWEQPQRPKKLEPTVLEYIAFLDTHVRVRVSINGSVVGFFAVIDNNQNMDLTERLPDGRVLVTEQMPGVPRSYDPIMTAAQLVGYLLSQIKEGKL